MNTRLKSGLAQALLRRLPVAPPADSAGLKRVLGLGSLIALGVGGTIGAGLFSLTGIAAGSNAGPAVVISFALAAVACAFAGLCYGELAGMIPAAGSAYVYAYAALGELAGWVIGWDLVLEYTVGASAVSVSWARYMRSLLDGWGIHLAPRLMASPFEVVGMADGQPVHGIANLPAVFIIVAISVLLMRGIAGSARMNMLVVIIKLTVIAAVIGFGLPYIKMANYTPFIPPNTGTFGEYGLSGILRAAGTVFFAYLGFDAISTVAQETRNPGRDMPIGLMASLAICTAVYIAFSFVLTGLVNYHAMAGDAAPVATAIDQTPFGWLKAAVKLGIICGFLSVILVMLLGQSRVFFAMARDGLLPPLFGRTHAGWGTPVGCHLFFMVVTGGLAAFLPIEQLAHMTSIGTLLAFVIVCVGVIVLRRREPDRPRVFRVPGGAVIPLAGIASCLVMMVSLDGLTWLRLVGWLAIGMVVYGTYGMRHSRLATTRGKDMPAMRHTP
ncbi:Putative amino acid permease YfnA [Gluconacetobacter sp. SXCC-1]|uniref:amino acid permease n=1 Tax=Komagataeibacter rhaeticus TaxID=215221 RepID=UPI0002080900|nr:amino acid permease [Komagataeibacter rhaeticus]EGG74535.1 Putative amino acid permease YfnA [Gluconacetobacter sp. SXCC-1]KDU94583.1 amino acid transporter [Komagataeibacter rhaeticus AF1]WPP22308.1 amino acid permease [Komagataeibacter rhaeticus]SAY48775.1 putative amino acid permease YhdG [Komagataeibacter rhaeticus]GBQ11122.1 amino acid transporter [Komagataeibacter rhaeticus DSM 16663]